ncbi:MAG: MotA/TolQ/ExbB proton channel family protein [Myxococcota bacterium]
MQLIGLLIIAGIVVYGFSERGDTQVSAFDLHALVMVLGGSLGAVLVRSAPATALRTFVALRELVPGLGVYAAATRAMEGEREQLVTAWREGRKAQAMEVASQSRFQSIKDMAQLILERAGASESHQTYQAIRHDEIGTWQPPINNWEMLSKLGPSFGMVGTITGMVQMFRNMSAENMNIGASMSLALLATLYGVAFGAGIAGPIGHFLNDLLDERLGVYDRCEASVNALVAGSRSFRETA